MQYPKEKIGKWMFGSILICSLVLGSPVVHGSDVKDAQSMAEMTRQVAAAAKANAAWDGPRSGPAGMPGKKIAMVCEDLRNGGVLGVAQGIQEAAQILQWEIRVFDAGGTPAGRDKAVADAQAFSPDGLILVGSDAKTMKHRLAPLAEK